VSPRFGLLGVFCAAVALALVGCADEEATPIDPANPPEFNLDGGAADLEAELETELDGVTHFFEPSEQMKNAAAQQCLDDPDLVEGYIKAVDPTDPDIVVSEYSVDCTTVRS
jgi:hypothetical protein